MDKEQQEAYVKIFLEKMKEKMVETIRAGKLPEGWRGRELNKWVAYCFEKSTYKMTTGEVRQFNNEILVRNL